jgi:hypothetical protein
MILVLIWRFFNHLLHQIMLLPNVLGEANNDQNNSQLLFWNLTCMCFRYLILYIIANSKWSCSLFVWLDMMALCVGWSFIFSIKGLYFFTSLTSFSTFYGCS